VRILVAHSLYPPFIGGGAETLVNNLAKTLLARGNEVEVLTINDRWTSQDEMLEGIPIHRIGMRNLYFHLNTKKNSAFSRTFWHLLDSYNLPMEFQVRRILRRLKPEIIIANNLPGFSVSLWRAASSVSVPVIQVLYDYYGLCIRSSAFQGGKNCERRCTDCKVFRLWHEHLSNSVSAVVGDSEAVLKLNLAGGLFRKVPIRRVIHGAREVSRQREIRNENEILTFGFIGTLSPAKGIEFLLDSFKRISNQCAIPCKLLVAGNGPVDYERTLKEKYGETNVEFLGRVDGVEFLSTIDVTVVPSLWQDPFPGVVYESLACETPVIGSRRGGIPEIIKHEINGLLFDPDIKGDLDGLLTRVLNDQKILERLRLRSGEFIQPLLNLTRMATQYEELALEVLGQKTGAK
jgi:glycosyltransferase involved in cell wall biosynthesis